MSLGEKNITVYEGDMVLGPDSSSVVVAIGGESLILREMGTGKYAEVTYDEFMADYKVVRLSLLNQLVNPFYDYFKWGAK